MRYRVLSKGKAKHLSIPEKPAEKTALSGRPCIAKTPEKWYALVRGD